MGWEVRGKNKYYTRSRKVDGKVMREYVGTGAIGEAAAALDVLHRAERARQAQAWQATQAELEAADVPLERFYEQVDLLVRAVLLAAGYYRHDRGEWRRRHGKIEKRGERPARSNRAAAATGAAG